MIKRILFPTDFSEHSERCIEHILNFKGCKIGEVVVLHVININFNAISEILSEEGLGKEAIISTYRKNTESELRNVARRFEDAGIKARIEFRIGEPFVEIIKSAEEEDVTFIVIGHQGENAAVELMWGNTAEKVARKSTKPVLLIR